MGLLTHFYELWSRVAIPQDRSRTKVMKLLLSLLASYGERTITGALSFMGWTERDWSGHYRHFSRTTWSADTLFQVPLDEAIDLVVKAGHPFLPVSIDDTSLPTSSRKRGLASYGRDPRSPPWHVNLRLQLRHVHSAIVVPKYQEHCRPLAVSTSFTLAPPTKKPNAKKATTEEMQKWKERCKQTSLSAVGVQTLIAHRTRMDNRGHQHLPLLAVVDGSYTNKHVMRSLPERTQLIGRCRKDIVLFQPSKKKRRYGERFHKPDEFRKDDTVPWRTISAHYGGQQRSIDVKVSEELRWRATGTALPVRIIVLRPIPYKGPGNTRGYRQPAYLITTDLTTPVELLVQAYLDRWQIEVLHRDLKHDCKLGTAQVRNPTSVKKLHAAVVATNAILHLAAEYHCGRLRTDAVLPQLPLWRRHTKRRNASQQELLTLLRSEMVEQGLSPHGSKRQKLPNREARPQAA